MVSIEEQIRIILKGAVDLVSLEELRRKLTDAEKTGRPLIVKLGLDPTAPDIHLGHAVVLRKIKQMQDLGHKAVIIFGDFTGKIGDPSGRSKTRRQLSDEEIRENVKTYEEQVFRILDKEKTEIRFNSEWLDKLRFSDVIDLASKSTVARMLERDDFKNRYEAHESIGIHEFLYPLIQAYDSVTVKADIELGGLDQTFNILMGRAIQKDYGQDPQVALFMPILEGTDGVEKMSKSLGNYIGIDEEPKDIYGKVMSIPDNLIIKYFELATDIHPDEIYIMKKQLDNDEVNPRDTKMRLAFEIVTLYHGRDSALAARENFITVFQQNKIPDDMPVVFIDNNLKTDGKIDIIKVLVSAGFASSNSDARRLISGGAVRVNGEKITGAEDIVLSDNDVLQAGKRKFARILSACRNFKQANRKM
jgi:tyrosyl-tRNA synthetase